MGAEYPIKGGIADGRSSLGNFDKTSDGVKNSFGDAFRAAHSRGGRGHTFTYNNKLYTTDCRDGGEYRKEIDSRDNGNHAFKCIGHWINAKLKDLTGFHQQDYLYPGRDYFWTADVDRQRAKYHGIEFMKNLK